MNDFLLRVLILAFFVTPLTLFAIVEKKAFKRRKR